MGQRSRIAPETEAGFLRKRRGKAHPRPEDIAMRNVAAVLLLAGLVFVMLPTVLGQQFFFDRAREAMALGNAAGAWLRAALAVAFQNIPVGR